MKLVNVVIFSCFTEMNFKTVIISKILRGWIKLIQSDWTSIQIYREYVQNIASYQKYLTRFGELIIFEP